MTDTSTNDGITMLGTPAGRTWARAFAGAALIYSVATEVWLLGWGNPANSLHVSAQSWGFLIIIGVLGSMGLASFAPAVFSALAATRKTP